MKTAIFTAFLSLTLTCGFSQSSEISIEFIGNCGFHMTDGVQNFYIDFPYKSGAFGYMEFEESDLVGIKENAVFIFTHRHADHYSKKNLKKVMKEKGGNHYGFFDIPELEKLNAEINDFEIKAFKTKHTFFGISFKHYSFLITWHGKNIYISGDTTNPQTIGTMKDIDLAFVPYWILNNAKEQGIEIDADRIAIYHLYPSQIANAVQQTEKTKNITPMTEKGQKLTIKF